MVAAIDLELGLFIGLISLGWVGRVAMRHPDKSGKAASFIWGLFSKK